jgi:tyrosine-specific transport protein
MNAKFIGGILLIIGTSIGGGMLALPVANAAAGFWQSSLLLFLCWMAMTLGALFILETNLYLPPGKNMISMAQATLGKKGMAVSWIVYLLLLYTLLSAYISGGTDVFGGIFKQVNVVLPGWSLTLIFTLIFGTIVYQGIKSVDYINRGLMFGKLGAYIALIILITPYIDSHHFQGGNIKNALPTLMILITSFGFAIIVPNLRVYFNDDIPTLRRLILMGSCVPLVCYIAWDAVIMGTVNREGAYGLIELVHSEHTTSELATALETAVNNKNILKLFNFFTSISMLTAFLGVSLCLFDFLSDGLNLKKNGLQGLAVGALTFVPPVLVVLFYPGAYFFALNYAGIFCVILLLLLPALMSYCGREKYNPSYQVLGGKITQILLISLSVLLIVIAIVELIIS